MSEQNQLSLVKKEDLTLANDLILNAKQLNFLLTATEAQYVKERTARGGGTWKYVTAGYVQKILNLMFGFNWDFEIVTVWQTDGLNPQVICHGKLTVRTGTHTLVKSQFGNKDIVFEVDKETVDGKQVKKKSNRPLDIGNDYKAAASDALKKCAAQLGIAADVYNRDEFKEVNVDVSDEEHKQYKEAEQKFQGTEIKVNETPPPPNTYDLSNVQLF